MTQACPVCNGSGQALFAAYDENRQISAARFEYARCIECELIYLETIPNDLPRYYASEYYEIPTLDRLRRMASHNRRRINVLLKHQSPGRLLEIGPAFGVFALQAQQAGFEVEAIEMDARCCNYLKSQLGLRVYQNADPVAKLPELEPYDAIALWQVLEHLPNPRKLVQEAAAKLRPGGVLALSMPNPGAWQFSIMGAKWPHVDAPRHLTLISPALVRRWAAAEGLVCILTSYRDQDALGWNLFGWRRLLMNKTRSRWARNVAWVVGTLLGLLLMPLELSGTRAASYITIFKKPETS